MKIVFFLKSRLLFNIFCCFCMFVNKHFICLGCLYLKTKQYYNGRPSAYCFYVKTKILVGFHICISVPLRYKLIFFYIENGFWWGSCSCRYHNCYLSQKMLNIRKGRKERNGLNLGFNGDKTFYQFLIFFSFIWFCHFYSPKSKSNLFWKFAAC